MRGRSDDADVTTPLLRHLGVRSSTRKVESAAVTADALRVFATMVQLGVSVHAARLGIAYGAEIQARAEQVAAITERAAIDVQHALAVVRLDLTTQDLDRIQGFALALASQGLTE
jgi:hypothetical protein